MITDQQIAVNLKIPEGIVIAIRLNHWSTVKSFAQKKWNEDGYASLKRWAGAVDRILAKYQVLFGNPAFKPGTKEWTVQETKKSIAIWIDRVGSLAPLIKDMEAAHLNGDRPRTINWFIFRADGQACRWEMLWLDLMNIRAEEEKRKELDWRPSDEDIPEEIKGFIKSAATPVTPTWVASAKARLRVLSKFIQDNQSNAAMRREANAIEARLKKHGYNVETEL
ncbi:hypothetical protein HQ531_03480 [bacterium]|nr:hypothetical protein [bacterium]